MKIAECDRVGLSPELSESDGEEGCARNVAT